MTSYERIYPGATYMLDPSYNFIGYRVPAGSIGGTTSIQTANQLKEINKLLNQGMKVTELSVIQPDVFEMIPKDHLTEIKRLNELTGAETTVHAPTVDPSGFTEQGWSEENRESAERQFSDIVERSHEISKDGNVPVTIHASVIPGTEMVPETHRFVKEEEKGKGPVIGKMIAVNQESGQFIPLEREEKYYPGSVGEGEGGKEAIIHTPDEQLKMVNDTHWDNQLAQLVFYKERADELMEKNIGLVMNEGITSDLDAEKLTRIQKAALSNVRNADVYYQNTHQSMLGLFNSAYKYATDPKTKKALKKVSDKFRNDLNNMGKDRNQVTQAMGYSDALQNLIGGMQQITTKGIDPSDPTGKTKIKIPQLYAPVEEFVQKKAAETLSNVALNSYKKYGDKAPIVSVENPPYGQAIASGKDLKKLIQNTRQEFTNKLIKEGKTKKEAAAAAERLIGVTWDTSHIGMMRKQGFGGEQVVKETKEVAPMVKHLHYNDNFGSTHTDLPPGMGSLPMKDILNELEKEKFAGKRIFEGGNFFQHFQTSPFFYTLESGGSPIYSGAGGPSWNQLGMMGVYYGGMGPVNPAVHHQTYGAGFQQLPIELGGEMMGGGSRFAGTPNQ